MVPRAAIVMPALNRATLIGESIESALAQTCGDFELIVVDDGSTDATREVVRSYRDPRIRLLERPHRGMSASMNAGVRAARAPYYARLDSDDLWDPSFLAVMLDAMEREPRPGVVYARSTTFSEDPSMVQLDRGHPLIFPDRPFESMLVSDHASAAALVRVAVFHEIGGFDESLLYWEDWDFWLRASRRCAFRFVDRTLARLRIHPGGACQAAGPEVWLGRLRVLDKVFQDGGAFSPEAERLRPLAYRNLHLVVALSLLERGRRARAGREVLEAIRVSGAPVRTVGRLLYLLALDRGRRRPAVRRAHRWLSRARQRLRLRSGTRPFA